MDNNVQNIRSGRALKGFGKVLSGLGLVIAAIGAILGGAVPVIIVGVVLLIIGGLMSSASGKKLQAVWPRRLWSRCWRRRSTAPVPASTAENSRNPVWACPVPTT